MEFNHVKTPAYVIDKDKLKENLALLTHVQQNSGAKILLAQKAFSTYSLYGLIGEYLAGTTASGLYEARLGHEEMKGGEVHVYSPAYSDDEIEQLAGFADHIVFNTPNQWERFKDKILASGRKIKCGIRINPEYSEIETDIYNPCISGSRLGTKREQLAKMDLAGITGIHFHTMCEQGAEVLARTLDVVEEKFGAYLHKMEWINIGGGHHITKDGYNVTLLTERVKGLREKYNLDVYIEPGEAVALNAGYLVTTVRDIMNNDIDIAILDTSAACHMPDVLEMPYRPFMIGSGPAGEKKYTYRLGGPTCLAGDIIGDYSFDEPLEIGKKLVFTDMAIYTMVKNNTFNGMPLPSIYIKDGDKTELVKEFSYEDFKNRL
ncbi:MAG: carboxynorspermidine decarboxylase [Clostridium sp.]|nr:carboxynorspermidine decarboxylase [Clostridium sp.]MCM1398292.1 carboxynorspermidine decarboxylase [Clostridium sp.]MCM1459044.1 carboxynorspermidine decarboxylase [Bacteroides sp.]